MGLLGSRYDRGGSGGVVSGVVPGTTRYSSPWGTSHGVLVRGWFWIVNGRRSELGNRAPVRIHARTGEARILAVEFDQRADTRLVSSLRLTVGVPGEGVLKFGKFLAGAWLGFDVSSSSCQQLGVHQRGER